MRAAIQLPPARPDVARDERFARLVPAPDWARLPPAVRRRFSQSIAGTGTALYAGEVAHTHLSRTGWILGQLARLVGAPLPLAPGGRASAAVVVAEDAALDGQRWTRIYARPGRVPQVIHSLKRFGGATGLEECVSAGVGMRLVLAVEHRALVFRSTGFFWRVLGRTLELPAWLTPGTVEVVHREERDGAFSFTLTVRHPWLGLLVEQVAFFRDCVPPRRSAVLETPHPRLTGEPT